MSSRKKSLRERWKQHTLGNQVLVITGALVAFSSIVYTATTMYQAYVFKQNAAETAKQTDKMIAASERTANISAAMAEDARKSNSEMLDKAERITRANEELANATGKQANSSQALAKAAESSARAAEVQANASQVSARAASSSASATEKSVGISEKALAAYISIESVKLTSFAADKTIVTITLKNDGNSPAIVAGSIRVNIRPDVAPYPCISGITAPLREATITPHATRFHKFIIEKFSAVDFALIKQGVRYLTICGRITYTTLDKSYSFDICGWFDKDSTNFYVCEK